MTIKAAVFSIGDFGFNHKKSLSDFVSIVNTFFELCFGG